MDIPRQTIPRGSTLPIDCTYHFSFGRPVADPADLPEGYSMEWIKADDPRIAEAGFDVAAIYISDGVGRQVASFNPEHGGKVVSFLYLKDANGFIVATWDEGRWWTPDESAAFLLMIRVPDTYIVAEGISRSGLNRQQRRRKR